MTAHSDPSFLSLKMQGCEASYKDALVVLFGAPFDGTVSFRPGSRFGPQAMRQDSIGLETYSPYLNLELNEKLVCDLGDLDLPMGDSREALRPVRSLVRKIVSDGKIPLMLGGEHLLTLASFEALLERFPDLCLLQLDAHADLRDDYLGQKYSHATVVRRIWEKTGDQRIFQLGIRSGTIEEFAFAHAGHTGFYPLDMTQAEAIVSAIGRRPVYLTIDLDIYDPSVLPGTGTPEPGGAMLGDVLQVLQQVLPLQLAGADLMELSPHYDQSGISTALAIKTLRELILTIQKQYIQSN